MATESEYDVFLSYNSSDRDEVREIAKRLVANDLTPWFDEWDLQPGRPWQRQIEEVVERMPVAAAFVGKNGVGPWQKVEIDAYLREFVARSCPVIPVILETCRTDPELPAFLQQMTWVDFRCEHPDPFEQLLFGITGRKPANSRGTE